MRKKPLGLDTTDLKEPAVLRSALFTVLAFIAGATATLTPKLLIPLGLMWAAIGLFQGASALNAGILRHMRQTLKSTYIL